MTEAKIQELESVYNPKNTEAEIYKFWEETGCFKADASSPKPSYSIVIPPPNVTGVLHMGHALDETLQDILIRYHRMSGFETLWMPGTDHAGIATQNVVEKKLREKGLSRFDLGREEFLKVTWDWANEHKNAILEQCKRLGASFDMSRARFTLDKGCSDAVKEVFVKLYEKDLIYKGKYIVNWCPRCMSAISDVETDYETEKSSLWEIIYPLKNETGAIVCATTRPETIYGDAAIAVHPDDYKYKDLIGKTVLIPLTGREIPIIADEFVDRHFGTGAVKITPAHDPNDYEAGRRHGLKPIWVIDEKGCMKDVPEVHPDVRGLTREEAREKTIGLLKYNNSLLRIKPIEHNVGKCQRCGTTIEPLLSEQWFVRMEPLAKAAIEAVETGKIKFIPERWTKNYLDWMKNIRDWCISRQLWWGHQIPAYYHNKTGEMVIAKENPNPAEYTQDSDVLDTWFSSGLWPFSTMGWPDTESADYKKFYPTSVLVTGFDIIFFWVARMITMGEEFTKKAPFSTVYIHGLIRDEKGQKMSKSKGNTIDPVGIIDKYGCDALRFTLTSLCTYGGQDIKISDEKFEYGRNFANKIWNASRFVLMNLEGIDNKEIDFENLTLADKWILNKLNDTAAEINEDIKNYRIGETAHALYTFFWDNYCDWYLEIAKIQLQNEDLKLNTQRVLRYVSDMSLRLLHPVMPHITEKIWQLLPVKAPSPLAGGENADGRSETSPVSESRSEHKGEAQVNAGLEHKAFSREGRGEGSKETPALMLAKFPVYENKLVFKEEAKQMELVFETIKAVRNIRQSFNIPVSSKVNAEILASKDEEKIFKKAEAYLHRLSRIEEIKYIDESHKTVKQAASAIVSGSKIIIPLAGLIDINEEIKRQRKKLEKLETEKKSLEARINNEKFISNAKPEIIGYTKNKIIELTSQEAAVKKLIDSLQD